MIHQTVSLGKYCKLFPSTLMLSTFHKEVIKNSQLYKVRIHVEKKKTLCTFAYNL